MRRVSPTVRVSFGIVTVTISLLLTATLLGLVPDPSRAEIEARKKVCEALAVQVSIAAQEKQINFIETTLRSVVERNPDIESAGLRMVDGTLLVSAGDHRQNWRDVSDTHSTPTHVQVSIFQNDKRWGSLELVFRPLSAKFSLGSLASLARLKDSLVGLFAFVVLVGSGAYFLFLRRALRELDPAGVIPERVKAAFNALSEGLLIMDERETIVLANSAFAARVERTPDSLTGRRMAELDWRPWKSGDGVDNLPWRRVLRSSESQIGVPLLMGAPSGAMHSFMVNCAPIIDGSGKTRGILATFDDITGVEQKNAELQRTMNELEKTRDEVNRQNHELRFLATRDSLTGCLNRRAFFECFETALAEARERGQPLACIMADIDHFKSINDRFGHATGDKVITSVAEVLRSVLRDKDLVGRYGGEEFCIILPDLGAEDAALAAERVRRKIREGFGARLNSEVRVTISLGVASLQDGAATALELVNQADNALYGAKECGRNRVMRWGDTLVINRRAAADRAAKDPPSPTAAVEGIGQARDLRDSSPTVEIHVLRERLVELEAGRGPTGPESPFKEGYDTVTGLPGYLLFCDRVRQTFAAAKRNQTAAAILCVGVEPFRRINNTLGFTIGDALLRAVGERIEGVVRGSDTVAWLAAGEGPASVSRLGTDEFGVALGSLISPESTTWVVKRLLERLAEPFEVAGHEIYLTAAVGIGLYPSDSEDVEDLLRCASAARHHAEENPGPNRYVFFAREMNDLSYQHISMDAQMRHAIQRGEFLLHYQPKVDLRTGKITSVEALIRWQHPQLGLVSPLVFVPIAERSGFIKEIGEWVLRTACLQAKQWLEDGLAIRVAVNLSAVQLRSEQFVGKLTEILADVGISAGYLELEVTETAVMADLEGAVRQLHELRRIGAHIAIDDFGTGYSSLSYLKRFAADTLKIDGSFVADIATDANDAALVAAIIAMAHRLGLQAVAEGVETDAQLAQLRKLQCDSAQGYLFSTPVPAEQLIGLLKSPLSLVPPAETDIRPRRIQGPAARSKADGRTSADQAI